MKKIRWSYVAHRISLSETRLSASNGLARIALPHAGVAQLVEQRIRNAKVVGSTPISGTRSSKACLKQAFFRL